MRNTRAAYKSSLRPQLRFNSVRFQSTRASSGSGSTGGQQDQKKATGIKALMQEYGYTALAVYLFLSAVDYPICFLVVHSYGVDKVKQVQTEMMNFLKEKTGFGEKKPVPIASEVTETDEPTSFWDGPLLTEAILAYAVHKSLIFIRVPIAAAILPSVVKQLRKWGFEVGKQKISTMAQHAKAKTTQAVVNSKEAAASNAKFGTPVTKRQKWTSWFF